MTNSELADKRRANLMRWMERRELNQSDLARRIGLGRSYVSLILTPDRSFGEKAARSMELKLGMPAGYLDSDNDSASVEILSNWRLPSDVGPSSFALVPRISVQLSAGPGSVVDEESALPPLAFRRDWLSKKLISGRDNLRVATVRGDSMADYLMDGDSILIDTGQRDVMESEVYALNYGGELRVKRLSRRLDGGLRIMSDNKRYTDEVLSPDEADAVTVIGKVVWRAG